MISSNEKILPAWYLGHIGAEEKERIDITLHKFDTIKNILNKVTSIDAFNNHPQIIDN